MTGPIPVLLYHSVHDHPERGDRRHTVSRACFAEHVDAIADSGRVGVGITELADALRGGSLPERPVAITFDDGFADTYDAVEALLRRGLPSTVYVTTGGIGRPGRLSASEVVTLSRLTGVDVGAHAMRHRRLDELDDRELAEEVRGSKTLLEGLTQRPVLSFAYPHGAYDGRVRHAVIAAGYR
jgi:peptidoglycan/xylan/chitin deacetylase (PgdA/CDA1 family)